MSFYATDEDDAWAYAADQQREQEADEALAHAMLLDFNQACVEAGQEDLILML